MTRQIARLHSDAAETEDPASPPPLDALHRAVAAEMAGYGLSQTDAARGIGVGTAMFNRWLNGRHEGDNDRLAGKARLWLETRAEAREHTLLPAGLDAHAELGVTGEVMATLAHAQATGDVVLIHGRSGTGKSRALRRYADTRAGVHLLTVTCGITSLAGLYGRIARTLDADGRRTALEMEDAILARLEGRQALLAIDEAQHLSARLVDALRGLRDLSGAGLALVGDDTIRMTLGRCPQVTGRIGIRAGLTAPGQMDVTALVTGVLGRAPERAEREAALAAATGPGGMHALRRLLARAFMIARADGRDAIAPCDMTGAAAGGA